MHRVQFVLFLNIWFYFNQNYPNFINRYVYTFDPYWKESKSSKYSGVLSICCCSSTLSIQNYCSLELECWTTIFLFIHRADIHSHDDMMDVVEIHLGGTEPINCSNHFYLSIKMNTSLNTIIGSVLYNIFSKHIIFISTKFILTFNVFLVSSNQCLVVLDEAVVSIDDHI